MLAKFWGIKIKVYYGQLRNGKHSPSHPGRQRWTTKTILYKNKGQKLLKYFIPSSSLKRRNFICWKVLFSKYLLLFLPPDFYLKEGILNSMLIVECSSQWTQGKSRELRLSWVESDKYLQYNEVFSEFPISMLLVVSSKPESFQSYKSFVRLIDKIIPNYAL